jgi:hypothetical protein
MESTNWTAGARSVWEIRKNVNTGKKTGNEKKRRQLQPGRGSTFCHFKNAG